MSERHHAKKYNDWSKKYNWDTCKANRKEYGKFLCSFLTHSSDSLVVNMDGRWGTGKTELLRRLYIELAEQEHPVVYIDAWESDFSNDALSVVCSELIEQIGNIFKAPPSDDTLLNDAQECLKKVSNLLGLCLKFTKSAAAVFNQAQWVAAAQGGEFALIAIQSPQISKVITGSADDMNNQLIKSVKKEYFDRIEAMQQIKEQLSFLSKLIGELYGLKTPIVVLVDELDRCRPTYAIEMLEVIKHFFETQGCVFLVATDTEVLQHSIKAVYGSEFNSEAYLRRFFHRKITLPELSVFDYLLAKELDFAQYKDQHLELYPFENEQQQQNLPFMAEIFDKNQLQPRDIEQVLQKFFASLDYVAACNKDKLIPQVIEL
ncbi:KAP family P-loop NTPase fold protein [Shewanella surugensis]|uniref:KAP family NTPase n=1 Tax=Shewanella surugensis TaxID=212020 RepID=A0ABT0LCH2_9GAMM|nr:P-loop NTPase fold protein [Shewanella surugensis]MCL1125404.1 KAP family NTPase [Shewanella surugensis]